MQYVHSFLYLEAYETLICSRKYRSYNGPTLNTIYF